MDYETLANTWSDCLQQLNISHQSEPRDRYSNSDDQPDIVAFDSYSGCNTELDISVAHPWNKDFLSQVADEDEIAAAKREISKNKKYSSELDVWGNTAVLHCDTAKQAVTSHLHTEFCSQAVRPPYNS